MALSASCAEAARGVGAGAGLDAGAWGSAITAESRVGELTGARAAFESTPISCCERRTVQVISGKASAIDTTPYAPGRFAALREVAYG